MIKINKKTEYALRGLRYLANQPGGQFVMIREMSRIVDTSPVFLVKIFQRLRSAGLVESSRGMIGGFKLSREPERITMREILEAAEGPICVNECVIDSKACKLTKTCTAHQVWVEVRRAINDLLDKITLKDVAEGRTIKL